MRGKTHERLNILLAFPTAYALGYYHMDPILSAIFGLFWILTTFFVTPDVDTKSRSRKRLGLFGWVLDKLFRHRGVSHSFIAWTFVFLVGYVVIGWVVIGGYIPVLTHLITDKL